MKSSVHSLIGTALITTACSLQSMPALPNTPVLLKLAKNPQKFPPLLHKLMLTPNRSVVTKPANSITPGNNN